MKCEKHYWPTEDGPCLHCKIESLTNELEETRTGINVAQEYCQKHKLGDGGSCVITLAVFDADLQRARADKNESLHSSLLESFDQQTIVVNELTEQLERAEAETEKANDAYLGIKADYTLMRQQLMRSLQKAQVERDEAECRDSASVARVRELEEALDEEIKIQLCIANDANSLEKLKDAALAIAAAPFPLHDYCTKEQLEILCHAVADAYPAAESEEE